MELAVSSCVPLNLDVLTGEALILACVPLTIVDLL